VNGAAAIPGRRGRKLRGSFRGQFGFVMGSVGAF